MKSAFELIAPEKERTRTAVPAGGAVPKVTVVPDTV